jgi:hypothetical protein
LWTRLTMLSNRRCWVTDDFTPPLISSTFTTSSTTTNPWSEGRRFGIRTSELVDRPGSRWRRIGRSRPRVLGAAVSLPRGSNRSRGLFDYGCQHSPLYSLLGRRQFCIRTSVFTLRFGGSIVYDVIDGRSSFRIFNSWAHSMFCNISIPFDAVQGPTNSQNLRNCLGFTVIVKRSFCQFPNTFLSIVKSYFCRCVKAMFVYV